MLPSAHNPRTHSPKQVRQIADSIRQFGFTNPILIDGAGTVIAGHGRLQAARLLGMERVPTVCLDHMTEAQKRAYVIADNRLAENAGWDRKLLALEFQYLDSLELDFDLTLTGFEVAEIDVLIGELDGEVDDADQVPEIPDDAVTVSRPGDLWLIGRHRLLCGDATQASAFAALMAEARAQMVFIDPPYNVPIDGHVCGLGQVKHREFAMAAGEMSEAEFVGFLKGVFGHLAEHSADGAIHYVCMDWRHLGEVLAAGRATYSELKNLCVWNKDNAGMGSLSRSKHELVFVFKSGSGRHINNIELGRHGRYRSNVWDYPGINTLRQGRQDDLAMHPTVKPVALVTDAIRDCSRRDGVILDCFAGSGTTLVAAEQTGRIGYGMELDPVYVDTIVRRLAETCGLEARHGVSGETFADVEAGRKSEEDWG
ncbi:MAG TPA: DNA methyltransferase [Magnetospirillum sp.]|nr:DNA methyltransferase [Magnetospirillum sp.]